jgi:hypothetical protein
MTLSGQYHLSGVRPRNGIAASGLFTVYCNAATARSSVSHELHRCTSQSLGLPSPHVLFAMSDSLNWFKLGARSRTPPTPRSTSSPDQNVVFRRPGSSRISNHPNRASPNDSDYERARNPTIDDDATPSDSQTRGNDQIWYNPVRMHPHPPPGGPPCVSCFDG